MFNIRGICFILLLVLLQGCSNQNSQMNRSDVYDKNKSYSVDKVSFVDDMDVLVTSIKPIYQGSFLKIMAEFINKENAKNNEFVYQIEWYDNDGMLKEATSWKAARIIGNQKLKIIEMATVQDIVDYKIVIATKK